MTDDLAPQERKAQLHKARAVIGRVKSGLTPCWSDRNAAIVLLDEVDRLTRERDELRAMVDDALDTLERFGIGVNDV